MTQNFITAQMTKARKITLKVLHIKFTILVFLLVPLAIATLITSKTNILGNIQSYVVLTGSMTPTIPVGSVVYVKKAQDYKIGDVITFNSQNGQRVTHRIASVEDSGYVTRGDANNTTDKDLVSKTDIVGKNVFTLPYVGRAILFSKTPLGFGLIMVLPILIFIGFEIWNIKKELEKQIEKKLKKQLLQNTQNV